jgi:hypothetical protein
LGLKMRAADVGIVFWKKLRSSTFMARFTGAANMSFVDIDRFGFAFGVGSDTMVARGTFILVVSEAMTQGGQVATDAQLSQLFLAAGQGTQCTRWMSITKHIFARLTPRRAVTAKAGRGLYA